MLDVTSYVLVPDDWWVALCDVVMSTTAIERGRYRAVNVAGAAVIAAVRNATPSTEVPFVFGGDGASLLVRPNDRTAVAMALAATAAWVRDVLELDLRAALIPVSAVRAAGHDLRVARYAASSEVSYAMFAGGGLAWAEAVMKRGGYAVPPAPPGTQPDLAGLSCRFETVANRSGVVLSLIVVPRADADPAGVREILSDVISVVEASPASGRPLPEAGPRMRKPWTSLEIDARAAQPLMGSVLLRRLSILARRSFSFAIFGTGISVGGFSPRTYRRQLSANADFRKYDDGLRLTIACSGAVADSIEEKLRKAKQDGLVRYGSHRQDAAVVTCISPSPLDADHIHFVDGAGGGYALAALHLKQAGL